MISLGLFPLDIVGPQFHDQQDLRARNEQSSLSPLSFVSLGLSCTTVLLYELLDSETKVQRVRSYGLYILHYVRPFCRRCPLRVFGIIFFRFCTTIPLYLGEDASRLRFMDSVVHTRRPTGVHAPRHAPAPCTTCTKKSRRAVYHCDEVFSRSEIASADYQVKVGTTINVVLLPQFFRYRVNASTSTAAR